MIINVLFENTELHQSSYERVHESPDGRALCAGVIASDDFEVIGELIHLISPLLEDSAKGLGHARFHCGCPSLAFTPAFKLSASADRRPRRAITFCLPVDLQLDIYCRRLPGSR